MRVVVVGAGISGLTVAWEILQRAEARGLPLDLTVLDENEWAGGKIRSLHRDGYVLEWGPNGFLDSKPATLALVHALGADDRLLPSDDSARKRFVWSRGRLQRLPENPTSFLKSRLLSWPAKLRIACEPIARRRREGVEETVAAFARRRLGKQALARLIDPMVSGVFAGDPETLSLPAAFPRIAELEARYGGLVKAMRTLQKERKAARARGESAAAVGPAPGGRLTSFRDGLEELPAILATKLGERLRLRAPVVGVAPLPTSGTGLRYRVTLASGEALDAHVVVLAIPAYASARLLEGLVPDAAADLAAIPYARLAVLALGWPKEGFSHPLDGFGFLVPHEEERPLLGALWDASIFPGRRAADGHVLVRAMIGGARGGHYLDLSDEALLQLVRDELRATMGVTETPTLTAVFRHDKAIPNYAVGHLGRLKSIEAALVATTPGLLLAGNAYRGIGLNDCVAASGHVAARALDVLTGSDPII